VNPRFVQLLDIGTQPLSKALFLLYEAMATDKNCAGVCGEIAPLNPSFWSAVECA